MPLSKKYLETITYQNPSGKTEILDSNGYRTGEYKTTLSTQKSVQAFVSANSGNAKITDFGFVKSYDKTLMIADKSCDITEGAVVIYSNEKYIVKQIGRAKCLSYLPVGMDKETMS